MNYRHFETALYVVNGDINRAKDLAEFQSVHSFFEKYLTINKVYLETYRTGNYSNSERLLQIKRFFQDKGIKTSGGLTTTKPATAQKWGFFCYTQNQDLAELKKAIQFTAGLFDEIILDDFYFTNCKCESCRNAKGERSWTEFRLQLMAEVSQKYIIGPAREVNPNVKVIIKFPNWYEHYQNNGYNLEDETRIFDLIYTGTETRDPVYTQQHLQSYLSYFLMRYLENVGQGKNQGGWFDNFDCYNPVNFMEQAQLTLFAKAREVTLFCMGSLKYTPEVPLAGYTLERLDQYLGHLGNPMGVACYKPYHSSGEDYLHDYLGMLGIPLEPFPEFPANSPVVLLTASAAADDQIMTKIKQHLENGKTVVITSGLLKRLGQRGISELGIFEYTDKKVQAQRFGCRLMTCSHYDYCDSARPIELPVIEYSTNDSWIQIAAISGESNVPLLLYNSYDQGKLFVWIIPDNFPDLYQLPPEVLRQIRETLTPEYPVQIGGKAKIGLFVYDNNTFIVESFLPHLTEVQLYVKTETGKLQDIVENQEIEAAYHTKDRAVFTVNLKPGVYKVYKIL
ncbi:MAG TPA: permease [Bacillota bacterium]|nr:permease [Bacillota bacterium]